jgi:hypothetical protein
MPSSANLRPSIGEHPFARNLVSEQIANLEACAVECSTARGHYIWHQGEPDEDIYLIFSGQVAHLKESRRRRKEANQNFRGEYVHAMPAAGKKKKKKPKCDRCGASCCAAGEICVIRGAAGEQCVAAIRTCTAADNKCDPASNGGLWCDNAKNCDCFVTTSGAVACLGPTERTDPAR